MKDYDVIIVGGGHAGTEAASACARLGLKTLLLTLNEEMIANMPCNPSIGGSAKGIVVREIDALGGLMGVCADHDLLQIKMLNAGKGPGVRCLRAQEDKRAYPSYVRKMLLLDPHITIRTGMVVDLLHDEHTVYGVILKNGTKITSGAVILATGTYLQARVLRGEEAYEAGPDGDIAAVGLSASLRKMGLELFRLKTGTPPRIKKSSIDFTRLQKEDGSQEPLAFSFLHEDKAVVQEQLPCYLAYTNEKTHAIIRKNIQRSAQFSGAIKGIGPRYCPSIEGKITVFPTKKRHQLFLEPEFKDGESIYLSGLASSLPRDVQEAVVHSIAGLEHAEFLKYGYAIEYDALRSWQFDLTLKVKKYDGLYCAGQICGTSGYEEAGGLGLIAGINAAHHLLQRPPFILKRNEAYIGVMIDDIVTKGVDEPYRLLSSRAEYRLLLRHDNADLRLTPYGHELGLVTEERYQRFLQKEAMIKEATRILKTTHLGSGKVLAKRLEALGLPLLKSGTTAIGYLRRPEVSLLSLIRLLPELAALRLSSSAITQLETTVKYEGYLKKQEEDALSLLRYEDHALPADLPYATMEGLRLEAREKLSRIQPRTLAQASRIMGVNPSDIAVLVLILRKREHGC